MALLLTASLLTGCSYWQSMTGGNGGETSETRTTTIESPNLQQLDAAKQQAYTAPIGQQINWNNPANGDSGTITTIKDGYSQQGAYCREFQVIVTTGGHAKKTIETACQMPNGSWKPNQ